MTKASSQSQAADKDRAIPVPIGSRVWVGGHNQTVRSTLNACLTGCLRQASGPLDVLILAPATADECGYFIGKHLSRLTDRGHALVVLPAGDSPPSDFQAAVQQAVVALGLHPIAQHTLSIGLHAFAFAKQQPLDQSASHS